MLGKILITLLSSATQEISISTVYANTPKQTSDLM